MSGIKRGLATELSRLRDPREHSPNCSDDDVCGYCNDLAQALLPVVEREIAAARGEAWLEGHAAGRDYQGDGWNSDVHDPARDNPYRAALSPDPDRGEGEGK